MLTRNIATTLEMIKFQHTVFALPFALMGAMLASGGIPAGRQLGWILVAMVGARSAAMAFNRIVDVQYDRLNPRTAIRALPAGVLSIQFAALFTIVTSGLFVVAAWQLNPLCFYLSFPVLAILLAYSYSKRFTAWCHVILGFAIGLAPLGAWIALRGEFAVAPILLGSAVMLWIAGFDIIYACQDVDFDRKAGLFSLPASWGIGKALVVSALFHLATVGLLLAASYRSGLTWVSYLGIAIVAGILCYEHAIVKPGDLSRVNVAFFNLNGYVSVLLFFAVAADILWR